MPENKKIDFLITITESRDKRNYLGKIDNGKYHVSESLEHLFDSIKEELIFISAKEGNWVED